MSWTCPRCAASLADDASACPGCGVAKEAWTVHPERTRAFVITRARFEALRLDGPPVSSPLELARAARAPARAAPVLDKAAVRALAAGGQLPARLLAIRLVPRRSEALEVTLGVDFSRAARGESLLEPLDPPGPDGGPEVRILLVRGEGETPPLAGLHVVDVSEDGPRGFAPSVEVSAFRLSPVELPTEAVEPAEPPTVELLELAELGFETGRVVVLPDGAPPGEGCLAGLDALAAALRHAAGGRRLLVAGHTDTTGSAESNLVLSTARAENALLLLRGERAAWASHSQGHYYVGDVKRLLRWVARTFGWDTDPGRLDDVWTAKAGAARDRFRARWNAERGGGLVAGAKQGLADWEAFHALYDEELARRLGATTDELTSLRAGLRTCEPAWLGCGEAFPVDRPGRDGQASTRNRRVDLLFFDEAELPALPGDPPGATVYGAGRYRVRWLDCPADEPDEPAEPDEPDEPDEPLAPPGPGTLQVRLVDERGLGVANVPLTVTGAASGAHGVHVTDAEGRIAVAVLEGDDYAVTCHTEGARLSPGNTWSPAPFAGRKGELASSGQSGTIEQLIALVRRLELSRPLLPGADLLRGLLALGNVYDPTFRVLFGGTPPPPEAREVGPVDDFGVPDGRNYVLDVEEVVGQEGDTLASLAADRGLDPFELARLNWGEASELPLLFPDRRAHTLRLANLCLGAVVGLRRTDASGTYVFGSPEERAGTLVAPLPLPWSARGLATGVEHVEQVTSHRLRLPALVGPEQRDEAVELLHHHDGKGDVLDRAGRSVTTSHVLLGVHASEHRVREVDMVADVLATRFGVAPGDVPRQPFLLPVDTLYANTLAGDLGQSSVVVGYADYLDRLDEAPDERPRPSTLIGPGSEASHAELLGDLDGMLLGLTLPLVREDAFAGRTLEAGTLRVSEVLERYYTEDPGQRLLYHAGDRVKRFEQWFLATPSAREELFEQTRRFAALFPFKLVLDQARDGGEALLTLLFLTEDTRGYADVTTERFLAWFEGLSDSG